MDEFFEIAEAGTEPRRMRFVAQPPWIAPPWDVISVLVPDRRTLVKTDRLTVMLTHIDAYPTGASLRLRIMARWLPEMSEDEWRELHGIVFDRSRVGRRSKAEPEFLRIGVQLADGRKATNLDYEFVHPQVPSEPSLVEHGGGGSAGEGHLAHGRALWLWPLPPPEPFDLVIEWPALGIPVTRTSIDGAAIVDAAQGVEPAWLDPRT